AEDRFDLIDSLVDVTTPQELFGGASLQFGNILHARCGDRIRKRQSGIRTAATSRKSLAIPHAQTLTLRPFVRPEIDGLLIELRCAIERQHFVGLLGRRLDRLIGTLRMAGGEKVFADRLSVATGNLKSLGQP